MLVPSWQFGPGLWLGWAPLHGLWAYSKMGQAQTQVIYNMSILLFFFFFFLIYLFYVENISTVFHRQFVCRKIICVNACFSKTFFNGQLLAVMGRDEK